MSSDQKLQCEMRWLQMINRVIDNFKQNLSYKFMTPCTTD